MPRRLPISTDEYYFSWLCRKIGSGDDSKWDDVLRLLFYMTFRSFVPNDENRATDGLEQRDMFQHETGFRMNQQEYNRPCSVLEMLIALASRMAFLTTSDPADDDCDDIITNFWIMISNLNLLPRNERGYSNNDKKIDSFVMRRYRSDGQGGIFPLKNPRQDQREVELWYQMQEYVATTLY